MIEFNAQGGQKLAVNPAAIWHVREAGLDQTAIYGHSGAAVFVMEPYAEVVAKLREAGRTGSLGPSTGPSQ